MTRNSHLTRYATGVACTLAVTAAMLAQQNAPADAYQSSDKDTRTYDKHNLGGLWSRNSQQFKLPPCPECREHGPVPGYGYHGKPPEMTPLGQKRFEANKPSRGFDLGGKDALAHPEVHVGMRRAVPPARGNDPQAACNPLGAPRLVTFSGGGASIELIQLPDRIIQKFEWTWDNRDLWLDGRKLPNVADYLPRYNGYSVAKWEGELAPEHELGPGDIVPPDTVPGDPVTA